MKYTHTFAILAYKQSPYLEQCIASLKAQTAKSKIILCTSTPNKFLEAISKKNHIEYFVNSKHESLPADWNFAYSMAKTEMVTLAHQDDIYEPQFLEKTLQYAGMCAKPLIVFTDYYEIRKHRNVYSNRLLNVKKLMNLPWRIKRLWNSKLVGKIILAFGDPICCPSVTFVKSHLPEVPFHTELKNSLDYFMYIQTRKSSGGFVYVPKPLMGHRIYAESATTKNIASNARSENDLYILESIWPKAVARIIFRAYVKGQKSNEG